jgi:general L-amino acid transport system permease protein
MNETAGRAPPRPAFYNDPRIRALFYQALVLGLVCAAGAYLIHNTILNLQRLGVSTGFAFLDRPAGFGISQVPIAYTEQSSFGRAFLVGLVNTAICAAIGIVLATILGFIVGIARLSRNWLLNKLATVFVEVIRNIPVLLQLIFVYVVVLAALPQPRESFAIGESLFINTGGLFLPLPIALPGFNLTIAALIVAIIAVLLLARWARARREATGQPFPTFWTALAILVLLPVATFLVTGSPLEFEYPQANRFRIQGGLVMRPELVAIVLGLTLYTASYIAEVVRAGILAVNKGQTEASMALGLTRGQAMRLVIVPQAMRVIIPPLTNQYLNLTKNSSLGIAVGYPEFFSIAGTINNQTGQAVEVIAITMAVYLTFSLLIAAFMNWYNAKIALVER